ncbi:MAG TPA: tetratricopeptide repeat protein [Candidatus Binataceae bacterium]|nr:tetratricopeptide repeat protein [Candidatus Binataceae bacterium]
MIRDHKIAPWIGAILFAVPMMAGCTALPTFVTAGAPPAQMGQCGKLGGCAATFVTGTQGTALERGDYDAAIASYSEILGTSPNDGDIYRDRGVAYLAKGNYSAAISDFNDAIRIDVSDGLAYNDRGVAYYRKGDYVHAVADFGQALQIAGSHFARPVWLADAYWNRASTFVAEGEYAGAIPDYDKAISIIAGAQTAQRASQVPEPSPRLAAAHFDRGIACTLNADYDHAIADFTMALTLEDPKEPLTYFARGNAFYAKGDREDAANDYQSAAQNLADSLASTTGDADTLNAAAWILATCPEARFRQGVTAIGYAKQACDLTSREKSKYLDTLAASYAENGNFEPAVDAEREAVSRSLLAVDIAAYRKRLKLYEDHKPYRADMK